MSTDLNCHGFAVTTGRARATTGYAWLNMSRTDCSFTQHNDKDKSFKVPRLRMHIQMHQLARKQAPFTTNAHTQSARHDRWEKTQRSAVSRASLRQDSDSFTSPWLRRWSWPKPIFPQSLRCNIPYRSATVLKCKSAKWLPVYCQLLFKLHCALYCQTKRL